MALISPAHHLPKCPPVRIRINANPYLLPMPNNCALFHGPHLLPYFKNMFTFKAYSINFSNKLSYPESPSLKSCPVWLDGNDSWQRLFCVGPTLDGYAQS